MGPEQLLLGERTWQPPGHVGGAEDNWPAPSGSNLFMCHLALKDQSNVT